MAAVDPEDDSLERWVLHHFRYDPQRHERRNVVVGAWDSEAEFSAAMHHLADRLRRARAAGTGDPDEMVSGTLLGVGSQTQRRRRRLWERAHRYACRTATSQPLRDGPPERVTRLRESVRVNGRPVLLEARYTVGADPTAIGFGLVAPGQPVHTFAGYPVLDVTLTATPGGYHDLSGWVQVISRTDDGRGELSVEVDKAPFADDSADPLSYYGFQPRFFDAPANPQHPDGLWLAELFLVEIDVRRPALEARFGLSWGYYLRNGHPHPIQVQPIPLHLWRLHANWLRQDYPEWAFT